jgi:hypothetical protein
MAGVSFDDEPVEQRPRLDAFDLGQRLAREFGGPARGLAYSRKIELESRIHG